jgi:multimeric flavodoxin WrbA
MNSNKKKLLIVAHAPSPNTLKLREAAAQGAHHEDIENVDVKVLAPLDAGPEDVLACDAIILGTTENLGYMSGALKDFFDRSYYPCLEKAQGLPFAYYIRAGHDGTGTSRAIESITTGLRWKQIQEPLICRGEYRDEFEDQCRELGMYVAASLDAGLV